MDTFFYIVITVFAFLSVRIVRNNDKHLPNSFIGLIKQFGIAIVVFLSVIGGHNYIKLIFNSDSIIGVILCGAIVTCLVKAMYPRKSKE